MYMRVYDQGPYEKFNEKNGGSVKDRDDNPIDVASGRAAGSKYIDYRLKGL